MNNSILTTGTLGFIGTNLVNYLLEKTNSEIWIVDKHTYASHKYWTKHSNPRVHVVICDICDDYINQIFEIAKPRYVMNLAAESHVDNSISGPIAFVKTNVMGTANMLEATRKYYNSLSDEDKLVFRFLHVSTDEVYGDLPIGEGFFKEDMKYKPSSPYSSSKAGSDLLVNAWHRTYGIPTIITNCSNNYGKYQHHEKLIPHTVESALKGEDIIVYDNGMQQREWIHALDHSDGIWTAMTTGKTGETYLIGSGEVKHNIDVVNRICEILDKNCPKSESYKKQIKFVEGFRKGHDQRYAIDYSKIHNDLGWSPKYKFDTAIEETVMFFVDEIKNKI